MSELMQENKDEFQSEFDKLVSVPYLGHGGSRKSIGTKIVVPNYDALIAQAIKDGKLTKHSKSATGIISRDIEDPKTARPLTWYDKSKITSPTDISKLVGDKNE